MQTTFRNIGVMGTGTMGLGIIEFLVKSGIHVHVADESMDFVKNAIHRLQERQMQRISKGKTTPEIVDAMVKRIHPVNKIEELSHCDLIIEAIVEDIQVKKEVFSVLDEITAKSAILATNTSSISITSIAAATHNPTRVIGIHFFNPAPYMPLVEVIYGLQTSSNNLDRVMDWLRHIGKDPVRVKDVPGFLVNRIARGFHLEGYRLVEAGIATKEQIDVILRDAGFKMGPFELQDLIGIDINYAASTAVYQDTFYESRFQPHPEQKMMVDSGLLGQKTEKGHYSYVK